MDEKGILRISASEQDEIEAAGVRFNVAIEGDKFLFGNATLEKAQSVKNLLNALRVHGLADDKVTVKGVSSRTTSGFFGKDSRCVYRLSIRLDDLSKIPDYLGVLATQPTAQSDIEWIFKTEEARTELMCRAMKAAQEKAGKMAAAIGHCLAGIKICTDGSPPAQPEYQIQSAALFGAPQARGGSAEIGVEYRAVTMVYASVTIEFYIEPNSSL